MVGTDNCHSRAKYCCPRLSLDKVLRYEEVDLLLVRVGGCHNCREVQVVIELY